MHVQWHGLLAERLALYKANAISGPHFHVIVIVSVAIYTMSMV